MVTPALTCYIAQCLAAISPVMERKALRHRHIDSGPISACNHSIAEMVQQNIKCIHANHFVIPVFCFTSDINICVYASMCMRY